MTYLENSNMDNLKNDITLIRGKKVIYQQT